MLRRPPPSAPLCCSSGSSIRSARRQRPVRTVARASSSGDALSSLANSSSSAPPAASSPSCSSSASPSRGSRSTARAASGPVYAAGLLEDVEVELRNSSDAGDSSASSTALKEERSLLARSLAASLAASDSDEVRFSCFLVFFLLDTACLCRKGASLVRAACIRSVEERSSAFGKKPFIGSRVFFPFAFRFLLLRLLFFNGARPLSRQLSLLFFSLCPPPQCADSALSTGQGDFGRERAPGGAPNGLQSWQRPPRAFFKALSTLPFSFLSPLLIFSFCSPPRPLALLSPLSSSLSSTLSFSPRFHTAPQPLPRLRVHLVAFPTFVVAGARLPGEAVGQREGHGGDGGGRGGRRPCRRRRERSCCFPSSRDEAPRRRQAAQKAAVRRGGRSSPRRQGPPPRDQAPRPEEAAQKGLAAVCRRGRRSCRLCRFRFRLPLQPPARQARLPQEDQGAGDLGVAGSRRGSRGRRGRGSRGGS